MKICQIILSHGDGGLEKHVRELTIQLQKEGHELFVIADKKFTDTLPSTIQNWNISSSLSRRNPWLLLGLLKQLRNQKFDLIHAQASKAVQVATYLGKWLSCPIVGTLHNQKNSLKAYYKLDHVITVSKQLATPFANDKVTTVYNGITCKEKPGVDLRKQFNLPKDKPVLCAVGRLVHAKGFDLLIDAVHGLELSLIIIGDGPDAKKLRQQAQKLGDSTHCLFLGYRQDAETLLASSDAVVIPSRREGFSYVFNEALLAKRCIMAMDVPVANEVLPQELIVSEFTSKAFGQRLSLLLNQKGHWEFLMQKIPKKMHSTMTLQGMTLATIAVYKQVIRHSG